MGLNSTQFNFLKPQRLTDQSDGGGQITSVALPDNISNNLFPGVSNLDAVNGRLSARLLYLSAQSNDVLWYYGAGVYISQPPANPAISALLARAASFGEERAALATRIESYLTQGPISPLTFYGNAVVGQRAVIGYQLLSAALPEVGESYLLSQEKAGYPAVSQYVRITKVEERIQDFTDATGDFQRRLVTLYLAEPLRYDFAGLDAPIRYTNIYAPTRVRYTTVADAARYYGLLPLAAPANAETSVITVHRVMEQLVPSTQAEKAQADQPAQALPQQMFPCGPARILAANVTGTVIYLGSGVMPGTVAVTGTQTYTDTSAGFLTASGGAVAEMDYAAGCIVFPSAGTWTVTAQPAAPLIGPAHTLGLPINVSTRALVYVTTLAPIPAPGTLVVDYLAFGKWYRLTDNGKGQLVGASSAHGSGTLNYATGTVQLSLQALPDLNSLILFAWATGIHALRRDGEVSAPVPALQVTLDYPAEPGSLSLSWPSGGVTKTATVASNGVISGQATGQALHETGMVNLTPLPSAFPDTAGLFSVSYQRKLRYSGSFVAVAPSARTFVMTLPGAVLPLAGGSLTLSVTLGFSYYSAYPLITESFVVTDDGAGGLVGEIVDIGSSVNSTTGEVVLVVKNIVRGVYLSYFSAGSYANVPCTVFSAPATFGWTARKASDAPAAQTETHPVPDLRIDLTPDHADAVLPASLRFLLGSAVHVERAGTIYRNPSPLTDSGVPVGTLNHATGIATLYDWTGLTSTTVAIQALATVRRPWYAHRLVGRVVGAPVRPGSFQLRGLDAAGIALTATAATDGRLLAAGIDGEIDWQTGIYTVTFCDWMAVGSLTAEQLAAPWYNPALIVAGEYPVPRDVLPTSLVYNAVVYTYAPVDSTLIGIDTARLPNDGRVQVIKPGDTAVLHHTGIFTLPNPLSAGQIINLPRGDLSQVVLLDTAGTQVATTKYSANLTAGVVTMANPLDLSAYLQPLAAHHTLREMARISDVEISGHIQLARALTKTFPAEGYLSTLLTAGDRYARYANLRIIASWQGNFANDGALAVADYNDVDYPLVVTNEGCIEEDWAVVFETPTTVKIIGARVGQIASGMSITAPIAPVSALTGIPYFHIPAGGWGSGYVYGNALRVLTIAASFPHWHIRCTQPHDWTGAGDVYAFQSIGEVDP